MAIPFMYGRNNNKNNAGFLIKRPISIGNGAQLGTAQALPDTTSRAYLACIERKPTLIRKILEDEE